MIRPPGLPDEDYDPTQIKNLIEKYIHDFEQISHAPFEMDQVRRGFGDKMQEAKTFYLDSDQANLLLSFTRNNEKTIPLKLQMVQQFKKAKELLLQQNTQSALPPISILYVKCPQDFLMRNQEPFAPLTLLLGVMSSSGCSSGLLGAISTLTPYRRAIRSYEYLWMFLMAIRRYESVLDDPQSLRSPQPRSAATRSERSERRAVRSEATGCLAVRRLPPRESETGAKRQYRGTLYRV